MNANPEPQPPEPKRKIPLGAISLILGLLPIPVCLFLSFRVAPIRIVHWMPAFLALSTIAIIVGYVDLYRETGDKSLPRLGIAFALLCIVIGFALIVIAGMIGGP